MPVLRYILFFSVNTTYRAITWRKRMQNFEKLIEYVVNDETEKARELFHEIVVEKSRDIYEDLMNEDDLEEEAIDEDTVEEDDEAVNEESDAEKDDHAEKAGKKVTKDIEYDDKMDEGIEETELGGDAADDLIDDIEVDEEGMNFEGEEEEDLEDRVVDLEDKLDELMSEFEELMGKDDEPGDEMDMDMDMDMEVGDEVEIDDEEMETESYGLEENVDLTAAPKPTTKETGADTKSPVAANSGAKGAVAKPVSEKGGDEKGRPAPKAQDMGSTTKPDEKPAPKADNTQASGVNTKSVID